MDKYATNSPKVLINLHERKNVSLYDLVYPEVLKALIKSTKQTEDLWSQLQPKLTSNNNFKCDDCAFIGFYRAVEIGIAGVSIWEAKTKNERKERCEDITKKAKELSNLLRETPFDEALLCEFDNEVYYNFVFNYFTDSAIKNHKLIMSIDTSKAKLEYEITNKHKETLIDMGFIAPLYSHTLKGLVETVNSNLEVVINGVANKANNKIFFVRTMSNWFNQYSDSSSTLVISLLTELYFPDKNATNGVDQVKGILKRYNNQQPCINTSKLNEERLKKIQLTHIS